MTSADANVRKAKLSDAAAMAPLVNMAGKGICECMAVLGQTLWQGAYAGKT